MNVERTMIWIFGFIVLKVVVKKRKRLRNTCFCVGAEKLEQIVLDGIWCCVYRYPISNTKTTLNAVVLFHLQSTHVEAVSECLAIDI